MTRRWTNCRNPECKKQEWTRKDGSPSFCFLCAQAEEAAQYRRPAPEGFEYKIDNPRYVEECDEDDIECLQYKTSRLRLKGSDLTFERPTFDETGATLYGEGPALPFREVGSLTEYDYDGECQCDCCCRDVTRWVIDAKGRCWVSDSDHGDLSLVETSNLLKRVERDGELMSRLRLLIENG